MAPGLHAQRRTPAVAPAPPQPLAFSVKVKRTEPADIGLRIYGKAHSGLRYLIRTPPERGTLSEPRVWEEGKEISVVTYQAPADVSVKRERFTYAVQSTAGVSAPVEVVITILDEEPLLVIPDTLDFTTLLAGQTAAKTFEILNKGGGMTEGAISVDAPWRIEGGRRYRLGAEERMAVKLVFAPVAAGSFGGEVKFSSDRGHTTALRGEAVAPIAVSPATLELRHTAGSAIRGGTVEIANNTDASATLTFAAGPRVLVQQGATIPPHAKIPVMVRTDAADMVPLEDELRVEGSGFTARVALRAAAVGPILHVTPETIVFQGRRATFTVENLGGAPGTATMEIAPPFQIAQPSVAIAPGQTLSVAIDLPPGGAERLRTWLTVKIGEQKREIAVEAEATGAPRTASAPRPASRTAPTRSAMKTAASEPGEISETGLAEMPQWVLDKQSAKVARVRDVTDTAATIEWPGTLSSAEKFRIEGRQLSLGKDRKLETSWVAFRDVPVTRADGMWRAQFDGLRPMQPYTLRVLPLAADGTAGERLFIVDLHTKAKAPSALRFTPMRGLLLAALMLVGITVWRRVRGR